MATNWAKDGLDAYLSLTGEHRAQQQADSAEENRKQMMTLAVNQDTRSAAAAGLTNTLTQLQIDEDRRNKKDLDESDIHIGNYIKYRAGTSPLTPNTNDPAEIAQAKAHAAALAQIGTRLNSMPPGVAELPIEQLSPAEQAVYNTGPGKDLVSRIGKQHVEEGTGRKYTIAQAGPLRVVKEDGKPAIVTPTMIATYDDTGAVLEVPYTLDGTNKGDGIVRQFTGSHLIDNAGAALSAINKAEKTGGTPSDFHADSIYQRVMALPRKERRAWYAAELTKDQARHETSVYDESIAKEAAPYLDKVTNLQGTAAQRQAKFLDITKGAKGPVIAYLKSQVEVSNKLFEHLVTAEAAKAKADEDRQARIDIATERNQTSRENAALIHSGNGGNKDTQQTKRDVSTRLREAQRGYQAAVKKGNPDAIAEAVDFIESLNVDAKAYGVPPLPVPKRPMTSDEEAALYDQATKTVGDKRGFVAKQLNLDPNKQEVEAEFQRLKLLPKPKATMPAGADISPSDTLHTKPQKQQPAPQKQTATQGGTPAAPPPASQHAGRIIKDTATGKRYKSNGVAWQEVQ